MRKTVLILGAAFVVVIVFSVLGMIEHASAL